MGPAKAFICKIKNPRELINNTALYPTVTDAFSRILHYSQKFLRKAKRRSRKMAWWERNNFKGP